MSDIESTADHGCGAVVNRRALLRAGGVVAGIAGIGGYAAAHAPAAEAAAGDPVLIGVSNDAGTASTVLTSDAAGATLTLTNTGTGASLRLPEQALVDLHGVKAGDLWNAGHGNLKFAYSDSAAATVLTRQNYQVGQLIPVIPTRIFDTRRMGSKDPTGDFDRAGRLIGGHTIEIDLGAYMVFHGIAVLANLTVTQAVSDGYLTLWASGTRPGTSSLNYSAGQTVANFCVSGLYRDKVRLYAKSTTHVVLDVVAFVVYSSSDINDAVLPEPDPSGLAGASHTPPAWWTSQNR